ncbi:TetR/AcrR family transcriptional regulator [Clostridium sp. OS1-26]|uniref:TetR/AcrR family transcriptional regulator n=1 Tax=Clostridium sp. OS1-26 TaxID=3070681 RepID=UPI0027DF7444|nr:TetR/AcrR family transcriptional regulator [Clostridium sp. OS1-26]WML34418.1 TetR/AcrR family transcriptional regulator [Clostridium sp. OS1-26]
MISKSQKNDRQVIKTRNLIQDAFLSLANEKSFEDITVKDISERAPVNRSTFYAHFEDKYNLLDSFISDKFMTIVSSRIHSDTKLTEETLRNLILIMCDYHQSIGNNYTRLYKSAAVLIDIKVQIKLQDIVLNMLINSKTFSRNEQDKLELITVMISSGIYCATKRWHSKGTLKNASALIKEVLPFMSSGLKSAIGKVT